jgi:hypothetical protein
MKARQSVVGNNTWRPTAESGLANDAVRPSHVSHLVLLYFFMARTRTNVYFFTSQLAVAQALDDDEGMSQRMPFSTLCQR